MSIENLPATLKQIAYEVLSETKRCEELERKLETVRVGAWLDTRTCKPEQSPNARTFWATIRKGSLTRVALVAWFNDYGFCETTNVYGEDFGEQVLLSSITHWMPTNMPLYPATR